MLARWRKILFLLLLLSHANIMAEEAQRKVESALSNFVDELEKSNLRKMQV